MKHVTSKDGTTIAYDQLGQGPAVIVVGGVLGDRSQQAPLAALLSEHFTIFNYDRRGHGESGDTAPYAPERDFEDLDALLNEAGGSASVYGTSGCAILSLHAAAWGLAPKIKKLAVWEPPYFVDNSRPPLPYRLPGAAYLPAARGSARRHGRTLDDSSSGHACRIRCSDANTGVVANARGAGAHPDLRWYPHRRFLVAQRSDSHRHRPHARD